MTHSRVIIRHALAAAALGSLTAISVLPFHVLFFVIWLGLLGRIIITSDRRGESATAAALTTQIVVMAAVISAAALAPVKTVDRWLAQEIILPRTAFTLAELRSPEFPLYRAFHGPDDNHYPGDETIVHFPRPQLTWREFIAAIKSQSDLRHHFSCCGNGWTILWGDYCGSAGFCSPLNPNPTPISHHP